MALYSGSISRQGNPSPWSVTPYFGKSLTQDMSFVQRILNAACLVSLRIMHWFMITGYLQPVLRKYLGSIGAFTSRFITISFITTTFSPPFLLFSFWKRKIKKRKLVSQQGINYPTCEIWPERSPWHCRIVITAWPTRSLTWRTWWMSRASIVNPRLSLVRIWKLFCNAVSSCFVNQLALVSWQIIARSSDCFSSSTREFDVSIFTMTEEIQINGHSNKCANFS